jgi:hypothetical protein
METDKNQPTPVIVGLALKIEVAVAFLFLSEGPTTRALLFAGSVAFLNHLCEYGCKNEVPRKRLFRLLGWTLPVCVVFCVFLLAAPGFRLTNTAGELDSGKIQALFLLGCCFLGVVVFGRLIAFGADIVWHRMGSTRQT